jgi:endonuclease/exonuclease/phosphatase family metal-dependent hydrolase
VKRWTFTSWNVNGSEQPPLEEIAAALGERSPDVIALQEVRASQAAHIAAALGMDHHWALKHYPATPLRRDLAEGLAILTAHDLSATGSASLTPRTSRWTWRHRIVQCGLVQRPDHSGYRVMNVHLSPHDAAEQRREEVERLVAVAGRSGAPLVIAGDLNDDGDTGVIDALPAAEPVPVPPATPSGAPCKRFDHVLVPPGATDVVVDVPPGGPPWTELSDHLPLTVSFGLEWVEGDFAPPS